MGAGDRVPEFYIRAKQIIPDLPPLRVGPDLPPGSADAEAKLDENGNALIQVRSDYPPPDLDQATRDLWLENTVMHDIAHPYDLYLQRLNRKHHVLYWAFRGFPGTWESARHEAEAMGINIGWQYLPGESWAECFGAAMSGRWTKPEKTMNWGREIDPLVARKFFQSLAISTSIPPSPTPIEIPHPPASGGTMKIVDVRNQLPVVSANLPFPSHDYKDSNTVHWTGGSDTVVTDEQALAAIKRWHQQHINNDWGDGQRGAGIMYLEVIAPSGTVFITRDPDAHTWHCSHGYGNRHSRPILVICDQDDLPTPQQLASLDQRITFSNYYPHKFWVSTQCPGPQLLQFVFERQQEDDMFTEDDRKKLDRIYAIVEAEEPRIWTQRLQDWMSRLFKSIPFIASAGDFKGPDVTSGQPRT